MNSRNQISSHTSGLNGITSSSRWFARPWGTSRKRVQLALLVIGIIAIALILAQAQVPPVQLEAGVPGLGMMGQRLMIAVPITNDGTVSAMNVQVAGAILGTASPISPETFPVVLGAIGPDLRSVFQADFDATGLSRDTAHMLTITGTYQVNEVTFVFTLTRTLRLPPASSGSSNTQTSTVVSESLSGAPFPHTNPAFGPEINEPGPPVPTSPFTAGPAAGPSSSVQPLRLPGAAAPMGDPSVSAVSIKTNQGLGGLLSNGPPWWDPAEPSGASGGGVVFISFNKAAAYLADGASTFTLLDPTTIFPQPPQAPYGFSADQHVQYAPKIDRFIWLQQLTESGPGTPGAYRLAVAKPSDIDKYNGQTEAWTSWLLTPKDVGLPHATQFDFPSMSVGNNFLYINWDTNCPTKPSVADCIVGQQVTRIRLSDIKSGANPLPLRYTPDPSVNALAFASFVTQDTGDGVFWAGHNGTSLLRVFSWAESSNTYYWRDVAINEYFRNPAGGTSGHIPSVAPAPAASESIPPSRDWLFRIPDDYITGATRSGSDIWFAWNAAPNPNLNLPQPYIEMVAIDTLAGYLKVAQVQIWNPNFAFGLPSLSTNACTGEIGFSLAHGGGGTYPNHAVGFWGDFLFYDTTSADVTGIDYGDYVTIRRNYTQDLHGAFFDAFGYALKKASSAGTGSPLPLNQVDIDIRHVVFGRPGACTR